MPIFKDYNGNPIDFPVHTHNVQDTVGQRLVGSAAYPDDILNFTYVSYTSGNLTGGYNDELLGTRNIKVFYLYELFSTAYGEISIELGSNIDINSKYVLYLEGINDENVLSFINIDNIKFSTIYPYNYTDDVQFKLTKINNIGEFGANSNLYEISFSGNNAPRCIYLPLNISPLGSSMATNFLKASFRKIEYISEEESTAFVTTEEDGFMTIVDKADLDSLYDQSSDMMSKLKSILFVRDPDKPIKLIDGATFNKALKSVGPNATTITFTKTAIPESKLSNAVLISNENNEGKAYMYLDNTTIYISPENDNDILSAPPICSSMFYGLSKITTINFTNFDTSNVIAMSSMFSNCTALKTINVSNWNTSKVTDMYGVFNACSSLTSLDVSLWNTSKVTTMYAMFNGCSGLTSLNISSWVTSSLLNMTQMFSGCIKLTSLDLSKWDMSNVTNMFSAFSSCTALKSLGSTNSWNLNKITNMNQTFSSCSNLTATFNIISSALTSYSYAFSNCSTVSPAKVTLNYSSDATKTIAQAMIATKSTSSNIVLGGLV